MNMLRQSAVNEICLELGLNVEEYPAITLRFFQNGTLVLSKTLHDGTMEGNTLRLTLRPDETRLFSPQRFAMELEAVNAAGDKTVLSEEITGLVARSKRR